MFVLTDDKSGGVYAVRDDDKMEESRPVVC